MVSPKQIPGSKEIRPRRSCLDGRIVEIKIISRNGKSEAMNGSESVGTVPTYLLEGYAENVRKTLSLAKIYEENFGNRQSKLRLQHTI